jgi:hypothetical protein
LANEMTVAGSPSSESAGSRGGRDSRRNDMCAFFGQW